MEVCMFTTAFYVLVAMAVILLGALLIWGFRSNRKLRDEKMRYDGRMEAEALYQGTIIPELRNKHALEIVKLREEKNEQLAARERTIETLRRQSDQLATKLVNETLAGARK